MRLILSQKQYNELILRELSRSYFSMFYELKRDLLMCVLLEYYVCANVTV